jgi:hypothetical protein
VGFLDTRAGGILFQGESSSFTRERSYLYTTGKQRGATEATKYEGIKERPLWPLRDKIY